MLTSLLLAAAGLSIEGGGAGAQTAGLSDYPDISADGRYVVFQTTKVLAPVDANGTTDIYLRDIQTNRTELISRTPGGAAGNKMSVKPSISTNGRWVAFESAASNLVAKDTNGVRDVFLWDRTNKVMKRVSVKGTTQGNGGSYNPDVAGTAKAVAFETDATNLVSGDTNGKRDVMVWTRSTKAIKRVSVTNSGQQANGDSREPSISDNAARIAFISNARNLGSPTVDEATVQVRDTATRKTYLISGCFNGPDWEDLCLIDEPLSLSGDGARALYSRRHLIDGETWDGAALWLDVPTGHLVTGGWIGGGFLAGAALDRDGSYAVGGNRWSDGTGGQRFRLQVWDDAGGYEWLDGLGGRVALSADGQKIVAQGGDPFGPASIYILNRITGTTTQVDVP